MRALGIGHRLGRRIPFAVHQGSPTALFLNGEKGIWYDPADISTLFQDLGGTVPVEQDGDPAALMLDKSPNQAHATQGVANKRPLYRTDGTYSWLEMNGTSFQMDIPEDIIRDIAAVSVFTAARRTAGSNDPYFRIQTVNIGARWLALRYSAGAAELAGRRVFSDTFVSRTFGTITDGVDFIVGGMIDYNAGTADGQMNGTTHPLTYGLTVGNTEDQDAFSADFGHSSGSDTFTGRHYGAVLTSKRVSQAELDMILAHFSARTGVAV